MNLHKYYKDKYMLAFYDKEGVLCYLFDNVRQLHTCLGITDRPRKKSINTSISLHLSKKERYKYIRCFKEPMVIYLIEVDEDDRT